MRSRRSAPEQVADVARRRLELLSAELAEIRPESQGRSSPDDPGSRSSADDRDGSGELTHPVTDRATDRRPDGPVSPAADRPGDRVEERPRGGAPGRHAHRSLGPGASAVRWIEDRLPSSLQGRVRLTGGHLAVVALTLAAGLALTAWWVTRADGDVVAVTSVPSGGSSIGASGSMGPGVGAPLQGSASPSVTVDPALPAPGQVAGGSTGTSPAAAASGTDGAVGAAGSAGSAGSIVVDVTGKVRRPGIATLPTGSRVVDAIQAAGGARRGVRLGSLNLARVLTDGEQVVVGLPAPTGVAAPAASAPTSGAAVPMVDVNTATAAQLEELPGVGPVTAQAILDYRTENGAFTSVDALLDVSGIGDATLAKIAPYVTL